VRLKYEKLEKEFLASRKNTKEELNRYMEREVGTVLSQLSNNRMKIEAQLRQNHQVSSVHHLFTKCIPVVVFIGFKE